MTERQTGGTDSSGQNSGSFQQPAPPQVPELVAAKLTDVGRARPHNEDYVEFYVPTDPQQLARKGALYLVADGMGGHQAGEVASRGAVELVIAHYYSDPSPDIGLSLVRAFRAANQEIHAQAQADPSKSGMGTTLVVAVILGRKVYVANVGDSRAYLISSLGITQITEDHSWVEEQVRAGLLTHEQARRHPQRNLVTRALGSKPAVEVDLFEGEISVGDTLLLCTDGLTGRVADHELAAAVQESPPDQAAQLLVDLANERGGNDNITLLIVGARDKPPTVPVAAVTEPEAKRWVLPVLIGVAAIAALILGILAGMRLLSGPGETATPTATDAAIPPLPTTPTGSALPTEEVVPTLTETPLPTPTATAEGPTATLAPTSTDTPQSRLAGTPEQTPGTPTQTASPLPQPTEKPRQPTDTPRPPPALPTLPTIEVSPFPTPQTVYFAPSLSEPAPGEILSGQVTFSWMWDHEPLPEGVAFDLRIWSEDEQHTAARGVQEPSQETGADVDLQYVAAIQDFGPGEYFWSVVVVMSCQLITGTHCIPELVGEWGEMRGFTYAGEPDD
jgi:serine/threonine protein phosphatase PrpC